MNFLPKALYIAGLAGLVGAFFFSSNPIDEVDPQNTDDDEDPFLHLQVEDLENLKDYYDTVTKDTLRAINQAEHLPSTTTGSAKRGKRSLLNGPPMTDEHGVYRLQKVEPLFSLCRHAINIKFLDFDNETYALCVSATTTITLGKISSHGWHPVASWEVRQPRQAEMFADRGLVYIVATDADNPDGTELLMYSKQTDHVLLDHTIHSRQATAIAVWTMEHEKSTYHLAIANSPGPESKEFHDSTYIYEWKGTYFDKYSSFRSYDVHDLEAFHIHSNVFLAVANHRVSISNYHIDSEIFKYDINRKKWKSFQRIRTYAASDWEFFALGQNNEQEFFLAVANQFDFIHGYRKYDVNSVVYKYVENKFVPYQCLQTSGATHIAALKGPKQEFILAISNYYEAVQLYQYNGWKFVLSSVQYTQGSMIPGAVALSAHYLHDSRIALAVSNPILEQEINLYALSFQHENKLQNWYRQSVSWCKSAQHKAESLPTSSLLKNLSSLPLIDQDTPIHLQGGLIFDDDATISGSLGTPQLKDMATSSVFDHSILHDLKNLDQRLQDINNKIHQLKNYLLGAVHLSGDQIINGIYNFRSAALTCEAGDGCEVSNIQTHFLNGDNVEGLSHNILKIDANSDISIPLEIENVRARDISVGGLLSGINTSHIISRSGNHFLKSPTIFRSPVFAENVIVSGLSDGIHIDANNLLLDHGDQVVLGNLVFDSIGTENLQIDQNMNNIPLNDFYQDVIIDGQKEIVHGPMVIEGDVTVDNLMMHAQAKVNGIDLVYLWNNVLWKDGFQEIYAPINASHLHVDQPSASAINGLTFPGSEVILISSPTDITGNKIFKKKSSIGLLKILGSLNGLRVITDPISGWHDQLDIMVKNFPQNVFGHKTFPSIYLDGHNVVGGLVSGINVQQLAENIVKLNATQEFIGTWIFNKASFYGPLEVMGNIEEWSFADLFHKALKLSHPLPSHSTIVFNGLVQMDQLNSHSINGIDVSKDLVTKKGNQVLRGLKSFSAMFLVGNSVFHGLVNGVNLAFLHDCLLNHGDQVFMEGKSIENDLILLNMKVGQINGIPFNSFVSLKHNEVLMGTMTLENPTVENFLNALSLKFTGLLNNATFEDLLHNTMTFLGHQDVQGHKTILGNMTFVDGSNLHTSNLNGIDLALMASDVVFHDLPQMITGKKTFLSWVHFDNLNFFGSLDGVTPWDMTRNWMLQDVPQTISGDLIVNGDVFVNSFMLSGLINGLDVVQMNKTIAKINEPAELHGPIHFKDAVLEQNLHLTGKIQGLDLSEEAALRSQDNIILGLKHFAKSIDVGANLWVKGYVDGVKVSEMCNHFVHRHGKQYMKSLVVNGNLEIMGGLNVGGLLDGVDLVFLNATTLKLDQAINSGHLFVFDTLEVDGPLTVHGELNGIDVAYLMNFYMSLSKDQQVEAFLTLKSPVVVKGALTGGHFSTTDRMVNGINVTSLSSSVLCTEGDQMIHSKYIFDEGLQFEKDFHASKIGGRIVPDDFMMKDRASAVLGPVNFANNINILGDVNLEKGALLTGVDVTEWARNAVLNNGNFTITAKKIFENCVAENTRFYNSLNGVKLSPDSILLSHVPQELHGNIHFKNDLQTHANTYVGGLVNGVDLQNLLRGAVSKSGENIILGAKSFVAPVAMDQLLVHGTIDGVNVTGLDRKFGYKMLDEIKDQIRELDSQISEIEGLLKDQAMTFMYYEFLQDVKDWMVVKWHFLSIHNEIDVLFVSDVQKDKSGCTFVHVLKYSYSSGSFAPYTAQRMLPANYAVDIKSAVTKDTTWLFVGNINPLSCFYHEKASLNVYRWNSNGFDLVQVLEELPIRSLATVTLNRSACVVVHVHTQNKGNLIHIYCSEHQGFKLIQKLQFSSVINVMSSVCTGTPILFVTSEYNTDLYSWNGHHRTVELEPLQRIPASAVHVSCTENAQNCYMAASFDRLLSIYRFEKSMQKFVLIDKWELDNKIIKTQWAFLPSFIPQHLFLVLIRSDGDNLQVYREQGTSGFVLHTHLKIIDAIDMYAFPRPGSVEHFLAVTYESCANHFWHQVGPRGLILNSKIKGGRHHG